MAERGITVRYDDPTFESLQVEAKSRHLPLAEVVRQAVAEHLARQTLARAVPLLDATFGKHVDRLAALLTKVFVAADMGNWQVRALVSALVADQDPAAIMRESRIRALVDLRLAGTDFGADDEAYPEEP